MEDKKYLYFIGIDVSKKTLDVSVNQAKKHLFTLQISNNESGLKKLFRELKRQKIHLSQTLFCAEKTGDYSNFLARFLHHKKCDYWEETALKIKKSIGLQRGKSDRVDAQRISLYAYRHQDLVKLYVPKNEVLVKMEQLTAFRDLLIKVSTMFKAFISEKTFCVEKENLFFIKKLGQGILFLLEKSIKKVEDRLADLVQEDKGLAEKHQRALSVPGIGPVVSMMLLIKTNGYQGVESAKQLSCYMGLAPFPYQSGTSIHGKNAHICFW